ncbi:MAG: nucleotidyl transferase AbiEii/AbiGii toxin family protein [Deltaproteobacteria bacterium]|nr:nucleotidyl transferase AbiEii/AbiGii toxin family protein [Deltaproteobacteria bacterium]
MHTELLSAEQKEVLAILGKALEGTDYYLAGGTALAIHLGHRRSIDFDWFIRKQGDPETLFRLLKTSGIDYVVQSIGIETVYLTIATVQNSFIGYDYPMLRDTVLLPDAGIQMAAIEDIACMKLSAVASRGSRKDFFDLHHVISHRYPMEACLRLYGEKYQNRDIGHVIRSLVYFEDAEREPKVRMVQPVSWEDVKTDFERWVTALGDVTLR